ncbi:MAG: hypothetical protein HC844_14685 [Tabrizicola sp.]|nr:hypothetical protein [Tabrizicola sp.]
MNAIFNDGRSPVSNAVEQLVSEHGFRAVLAALMLRLLRRRKRAGSVDIERLSPHLRRDIGLPPVELEPNVLPIIPFPPLR